MSKLKKIGGVLLILFCLEVVSRRAFHILPLEVGQKYHHDKIKRYNGLGAQGDLYMGQPLRVAVFGSSIAEGVGQPTDETWIQLVKEMIGSRNIHFDNFGVGWSQAFSVSRMMRDLNFLGQKYDLVIMAFTVRQPSFDNFNNAYNNHYSSRWLSREHDFFALPGLLKKWFLRRQESEKWPDWIQSAKANTFRRVETRNLNLRQSEEVKKRLVRVRVKLGHRAEHTIGLEFKKILSELRELTSRILWMPERVAYHQYMLPEVEDLYLIARRTPKSSLDNPFFYDAESYHNYIALMADETARLAELNGIPVFEPGLIMAERLVYESDLFVDELHYSKKGSEVMANLVYGALEKEFPEILKNENR